MSETGGVEYADKSAAQIMADEVIENALKAERKAESRQMMEDVIRKGETVAEANKQAEQLAKARIQAENLARAIADRNGLDINNLQDRGEIIRLMNEIRGDGGVDDLSIELVKLKRFLSKQ